MTHFLQGSHLLKFQLVRKYPGRSIEQIAVRLAKYSPEELISINGVTQFRDGNRNSANAVNAWLDLTKGSSAPYMPGTPVKDVIAGVGQKLYVIENETSSGPGGWAVTRVFSDLNEARRELALLPAFKNQQEVIVNGVPTLDNIVILEYTVKQPLPTRQGIAGPQEEYFTSAAGQTLKTGRIYPGGSQQVELLIDTGKDANKPTAEWRRYLDRNPTAISWGIAQIGK